MNILIAIDSFKGSLTSLEAANWIKKGIQHCMKANVTICPIADGGEGFVEAVTYNQDVQMQSVNVHDAMGDNVTATYAINEHQAIMEMASVCGITLINQELRNPMLATTYGLGELIKDALDKGCRSFLIGAGGSVTNDGGIGMLAALGYQFCDIQGNEIAPNPKGLLSLYSIHDERVDKRLKDCVFEIACDVDSPIIGASGCSVVFASQKGADNTMILKLEKAMQQYVNCVKNRYPESDPYVCGCGAAGGLAFGFLNFTNACLISGAQKVMEVQKIIDHIVCSDLVITGEGCLDEQTVLGKGPAVIAQMAKENHKPVVAFAGMVNYAARDILNSCFSSYVSIQSKPCALHEAMEEEVAAMNLMHTVEQYMRMIVK